VATKEEYRLQTLLQLRERKKESAEQYLAQCLKALHDEQQRQREMEEELERMVAKREAKTREYSEKAMAGEMSAQAVTSASVYIDRLKEQEEAQQNTIEGQKAVVAQRQEDVQGARGDLTTAMQELKALEKHREKWEEGVKRKLQTKQEEAMDEIAQAIFLGRDS